MCTGIFTGEERGTINSMKDYSMDRLTNFLMACNFDATKRTNMGTSYHLSQLGIGWDNGHYAGGNFLPSW